MKKTYIKPEIDVAEIRIQSVICTSGVRTADPYEYEIEWGGVDEEGLCEPD